VGSQIQLKEKFENKWWRLNNLYWIINKQGLKVPFRLNWAQEKLFDDFWYLNIILKARQFGMTTFVDIYFLDECVFNDNVEAGIIAHNKEDAQKIFRRKVQFPYRNLPEKLKEQRPLVTDSRTELAFNNGSIIYVGTSMRSGTLQYLHVSEHGKICRKYPEKAEEIKTGSLNAVDAGQIIVIESTAEGAVGDFYDYRHKAQKHKNEGLTPLDFKFHFFPWFWNPEYKMDPVGIEVDAKHDKYFNNLQRALNVNISSAQKAWYVKKEGLMGFKMKQEFPSTPEEAFEASRSGFAFSRVDHVIKPRPIPAGAPLYMTFDWGFGAPYSIGWWWVDQDGRIFRFTELYGDDDDFPDVGVRETDPEIAQKIIDHERKHEIWGKNIIRLCDPTCFNKKPDYKGGGQGPSTAEEFAKFKIYMAPGDPSRLLKIRQFHSRLSTFDEQPPRAPMMQIYDTCEDFIRTIPLLRSDDKNIEDIDTTMADHVYDEACHIAMARPIALEKDIPKLDKYAARIDHLKKDKTDSWQAYATQAEKDTAGYFEGNSHEFGDIQPVERVLVRPTIMGEMGDREFSDPLEERVTVPTLVEDM